MPLLTDKVLPMSPVHLLPMCPVYTGDHIGGKREFASVEFKLLQKPFVAALARIDFQKLEVENRMVYGSFKERAVSVVRSQR